ncbi:NADPH2:quinone reductase [Seinonella peptonophila]|uniref:NADPH2:quinone reductase n=1 Tax=Seinonella peptonophila TaxID=112248 RepID=A0A1M4W5C6_9BACL|nr:zinc-dependent alcohol dehydrogenase family protein [Seinonella peptonophila]SHE76409.1 NADPH2:quinone reductase [Seinonella peptonophila]
MRTFLIKEYGKPEQFYEAQIQKPTVGKGQVLIKVAATSVNPIDSKIRQGRVPNVTPSLPATLHGDVAGIIAEVGEEVQQFQTGDAVYGCFGGVKGTFGGALSDYLLVDADVIAHKPTNLSFAEAAALPLVSITAWEALVDRVKLSSGQKILIHGGTGGVGHIAIQIAKALGAIVYTTCSTDEKAEIASSLGADHVINYRQQSVDEYVNSYTNGQGFDIVFDTVGGENIDQSFAAVKLGGQVVTIAARSTHDLSPMHNKAISLHAVFMILPILSGTIPLQHAFILDQVRKLVEQEQLRPIIGQTFLFHEVAQAHQMLEDGDKIGKIALIHEDFSSI